MWVKQLVIFSIQQLPIIFLRNIPIYIIILLKKHVGCNTISCLKQKNLSKCQHQDSYMSNLIMWICSKGDKNLYGKISSVLMLILMLESIMLLESSNDLSKWQARKRVVVVQAMWITSIMGQSFRWWWS